MIFCVDDDSAIREIEVYTLQQTGFKAKGLSCADELFLELKNIIPDLIILDIMMPEMDGVDTLKALVSTGKKMPPIVALTANSFEGIRDDFIKKGFTTQIFCDIINYV